ncbi:MAG: ATP-dependent DNA ligase [Candidatus Aenigmarchaeota archaeon]|nr:ATP-dependent DNA ligase [Candidatus Aenigmarchaeota archaeon]
MKYSVLADVYEELEKHSSKLKKRDILAELLKEASVKDLGLLAKIITGSVSSLETGVSTSMIIKAIGKASGNPESEVKNTFKRKGDLGITAEELIKSKKQRALLKKELSVENVYDEIVNLPEISGKGSQERKLNSVAGILIAATPKEAKYIVRTILGQLRVGVAQGILRDSIAKAFDIDKKLVESAWNLNPDFGKIAEVAKKDGEEGLKKIVIDVGSPLMVLLAEKSPSLKDALESYENPVLEVKFDGVRTQIHKKGDVVKVFTRKLEDVTKQFPDIVKMAKTSIIAKECIIDGEAVGMDPKTNTPLPFQKLSRRIQRKYDIEKMIKEIPVEVNIFDITYLNGKSLYNISFKERRKLLEKSIKSTKDFKITKQLKTKDLKKAEDFYNKALAQGQEGIMVKNLEAGYQPGRKVGYWLKVKPTMENLDLTIIGGVWGTGKRTGFVGSLILGCRDKEKFLTCGMLGTGLKEKKTDDTDVTLEEITRLLKPHIISEKGSSIEINPHVVVEVGYEEIQKSPKYESGYALRFPRLIRLRTMEKPASQADTLSRIKYLYTIQKGKK